jgi:Ca2+-binding RTX toxin-like protein
MEIEFSGQGNLGSVVGTPPADEFHWAPAGARPSFNLNPSSAGDQDADVTVTNPFTALIAQGAAGNVTIIPAPGAVIPETVSSVGSGGGPGNDLLVAPRDHGGILDGEGGNDTITGSGQRDLLYGGTGNDRIAGGRGRDQIIGGPGRDLLSGGRGRDHINARDPKREMVKCGPGRDFVRADRRDRLRGCEVIRRR